MNCIPFILSFILKIYSLCIDMMEIVLNYSFPFMLFTLISVFHRLFYNNPGLRFNIRDLPAQVNKLYVSGHPH